MKLHLPLGLRKALLAALVSSFVWTSPSAFAVTETINAGTTETLSTDKAISLGDILNIYGTWNVDSEGKVILDGGYINIENGGSWYMEGELAKNPSSANTIVLKDGGLFSLSTNFDLSNGIMDWKGGTFIATTTISSGKTYELTGTSTRVLSGTLTNSGTLNLNLNAGGTFTIGDQASVGIGTNQNATINVSRGILVNSKDVSLGYSPTTTGQREGKGNINLTNGAAWQTQGGVTLKVGSISVNGATWVAQGSNSILLINAGTVAVSNSGIWTTGGLMSMQDNAGVINLKSNGVWNQNGISSLLAGTVNISDGATWNSGSAFSLSPTDANSSSNVNLSGGTWNILSSGSLTLSGGKITVTGGLLDIKGNLMFDSKKAISGSIVLNGGKIKVSTYSLKDNDYLSWLSGTLETDATIKSGAIMTLGGTGSRTLIGSLSNQGTMIINGGNFESNGAIVNGLGNGVGILSISGGTLTTKAAVTLGTSTSPGNVTMTGGAWNVATGSNVSIVNSTINLIGGAWNLTDGSISMSAETGSVNISGGTWSMSGGAATLSDGTVNVSSTGKWNVSGTSAVTLSGTAAVAVSGGAWNISGGTTNLSTGSSLALSGGDWNVSGGTVTLGGGTIDITNGTWDLSGGTVNLLTGSTVEISGGTMKLSSANVLKTLAADAGSIVLKGTGSYQSSTYTLDGTNNVLDWQGGILKAATTIVFGKTYSLAGSGDRTLDGTLGVAGTLTLGFTAEAESPTNFGSLLVTGDTTINNGGSISLTSGTLTSGGDMKMVSGGKLEVSGGTWVMNGTINPSSAAKGIVLKGDGTLQSASPLALKDGMALDWQAGTLKTAASIAAGSTYTMSDAGTHTLDGTLTVESTGRLLLTKNGSDAFGSLAIKDSLLVKSAGGVTISSGTLDMTNGSFYSSSVAGGVVLNEGGTYKTTSFDLGSNTVVNWMGGTLEANASISSKAYTVTGTGEHILDGNLSIINGGSLVLDTATDKLTVKGALSLSGKGSSITVSNGVLTLASLTAPGVNNGILLKDSGTLKIDSFDLIYSNALNWQGGTLEANSVLGAGNTYTLAAGRQLKGTLAINGDLTVTSAADLNNLTGITLNAGSMQISSYALADGGKLVWNGGTLKTAATIATTSTYTLAGTGDRTIDGSLTIAAGGKLLLQKDGDGAAFGKLDIKGALSLSQAGAVTISSGTLDLSSGSLSGTPPVGSIILQSEGTLKIGSLTLADGGVLDWRGGTLETDATIAAGNTFTMTSGKNLNGTLAIESGSQLILDGTVGLSGITALSGSGSLKKISSGTTTLSGNNTYSGGTEIAAGTLSVGSNQALGTGIVKLTGGTLDLTSNVSLANNLDIGGNAGNTLSLNGNTLSFGNDRGLTGSGDLTVSNNAVASIGTVTLDTNSGYTGNIVLAGGNVKLDLTTDNALGTAGSLTVKGTDNVLGLNAKNQAKALTVDTNGSVTLSGNGAEWKGLITNTGNIIVEAASNPIYLGGSSAYDAGTSELGNIGIKKGHLVIGTSGGTAVEATAKSITSTESGTQLSLKKAKLDVTSDVNVKAASLDNSTLTADNITIGSLSNTAGASSLEATNALSIGGGTHSNLSLKATTLNIMTGTMALNGSSSIAATTATNITGTLTLDGVAGNSLGALTLTDGILNMKNGAMATGTSFAFTGTSELHLDGGASKQETTLTLSNVSDLNNLAWSSLKNGAITLKNNSHLIFNSGTINLSPDSVGKITWDASSEVISTGGDLVFDAIKDDLSGASPVRGIANAGQNKLILQNGAQIYPTGAKAKELQLNGSDVVLLLDLKGKGIDSVNITDKTDISGGARLELRNTAGSGTAAPASLGNITASNATLNLSGFVSTEILLTNGISLSSGSSSTVNNVTLKGSMTDSILLSSNSSMTLTNTTLQDYGKMTVSASTLSSTGGKIALKNSGVIVKDASTVTFTDTTLSGGLSTVSDTKTDTVNLVHSTLDNVTINKGDVLNMSDSTVTGTATFNDAIVNILAGTTNYFGTLVSNNTTINVSGGASYTFGAMGINSGSSTDINGQVTGNIALAGGSASLNNGGSIDGDVSIQGGSLNVRGGTIGGNVSFNANPINNSVINLSSNLALAEGKRLTVDGIGTINLASNTMTVDGLNGSSTLAVDGNAGSALTINGMGNHIGDVELKGAASLTLNAKDALGTAGTLQVKNSNKVILADGADQNKGIQLAANANLELSINGTDSEATISGDVKTVIQNGTITKTGAGSLTLIGDHDVYGFKVSAGTLNLQAGTSNLLVRNGGITISSGAGMALAGGSSLTTNSLVSQGKLEIGDGNEASNMLVTNDATLSNTTIHNGSTLTAGGQIAMSGISTADGSLKGQDITLNSGTNVSGQGGSIETVRELNVGAGSSLTMTDDSSVKMGSNLNVQGNATISGTLTVTDKTVVQGSGSLTLEAQDNASKLGNVTLAGNGSLTVVGGEGDASKTVQGNFITMNGSSEAEINNTDLALNGGTITLNGQASLDLTKTTVNGNIVTTNTAATDSTTLGLNDVHITGNLTVVGGDIVLSGTNTVGGSMNISDSVKFSFKDGTTGGTLEVVNGITIGYDGQATIGGDHTVKSNVTMSGGELVITGNGKSGINSNFQGNITFNKSENQFTQDPKLSVDGTLYQTGNVTLNTNTDIAVADGGALILTGSLSSGTKAGDTLTINRNGENGSVVVNTTNANFDDDIDLGGGSLVIGSTEAIGKTGELTIIGDEATLQNVSADATVSKNIVVQNGNELTVQTDKDLTLAGHIDAGNAMIVKTGDAKLTLTDTTGLSRAATSGSCIDTLTQKGGSILMNGKGYAVDHLELVAGSKDFTSEGGNTFKDLTAGQGTDVKLAGDVLGGSASDPSGFVRLDGASFEAKSTSINLSEMLVGTSDAEIGSSAVLTQVKGQIIEAAIENGSSLTFSQSVFEIGALVSAGKLVLTDATKLTVTDTLTIGNGGSLTVEKGSTIDGILAFAGGSMNLLDDYSTDKEVTVSGNNALSVAKNVTMNINGALSGTGSLEKTGEGSLILNKEGQSFSGTLAMKEGSLFAKVSNAYGSTSTLRISGSDATINYGVKGGSAVVFDSGLSVDEGQSFIVNTAADTVWNGKLAGTGSMTKVGNSNLTINHAASSQFGVAIAVNEGSLTLNGKVGSDISLSQGTSLSGTGATSGSLLVSANDTIVEIGEAGKVSIATLGLGSAKLESSVADTQGVYKTGTRTIVDIDSASTASDQIVLSGKADMNNSLLEIRKGVFTADTEAQIADGTRYHIVRAGEVASNYNEIVQHDLELHNAHTEITGNGIDLVLSLNYKGIRKSTNENAICGAINNLGSAISGDLFEIQNALTLTKSGDEARTALDTIGGLRLTSMMSSLLAGSTNHMRTLRDAMSSGAYRGFLAATGKTSGTDVWVTPTAGYNRVDSDGNAPEFTRQSWGGMIGVDRAMGDMIAPENGVLVAGLALGFDHASTDVLGAKDDSDSYTLDLYASYQKGAWLHRASLGGGFHQFDMDRQVVVGDKYNKTGSASTNGMSVNLAYELSYAFKINDSSVIMPLFTVESSFASIDGFSETGGLGNASLNVKSQDAFSTVFGLGTRYAKTFGLFSKAPRASFEVTALVTGEVGDQGAPVKASFLGTPGHSYKLDPASSSRIGFLIGAGLNVPVSNSVSVFGGGTFEVRSETSDVSGNIGVRYSF